MSTTKQETTIHQTPTVSEPQNAEAHSVQAFGDAVTQHEGLDQIKLEYEELPLNWPTSKKWTITILVAFISGTVTFASSVHASAVRMCIQKIINKSSK